jgi:hypothetical protein
MRSMPGGTHLRYRLHVDAEALELLTSGRRFSVTTPPPASTTATTAATSATPTGGKLRFSSLPLLLQHGGLPRKLARDKGAKAGGDECAALPFSCSHPMGGSFIRWVGAVLADGLFLKLDAAQDELRPEAVLQVHPIESRSHLQHAAQHFMFINYPVCGIDAGFRSPAMVPSNEPAVPLREQLIQPPGGRSRPGDGARCEGITLLRNHVADGIGERTLDVEPSWKSASVKPKKGLPLPGVVGDDHTRLEELQNTHLIVNENERTITHASGSGR